MAEDAITYKDIYELLRNEKNSTDLEELDREYLNKVKAYLAAKHKLLSQQKAGMFSGLRERAKIMSEIENVRGAMSDLFQKRERKVINRALYTLRTDLKMKDTTNMLPNEVKLYEHLLEVLKRSKQHFLEMIGEASSKRHASRVSESPKRSKVAKKKSETKKSAENEVKKPDDSKPTDTSNKPKTEEDTAGSPIKLTFLEEVPELVDSDLEKHGPFEAGQTAPLPSELAQILLTQGKAKKA